MSPPLHRCLSTVAARRVTFSSSPSRDFYSCSAFAVTLSFQTLYSFSFVCLFVLRLKRPTTKQPARCASDAARDSDLRRLGQSASESARWRPASRHNAQSTELHQQSDADRQVDVEAGSVRALFGLSVARFASDHQRRSWQDGDTDTDNRRPVRRHRRQRHQEPRRNRRIIFGFRSMTTDTNANTAHNQPNT